MNRRQRCCLGALWQTDSAAVDATDRSPLLFWLAPVLGALIAGFVYETILEGDLAQPAIAGRSSR